MSSDPIEFVCPSCLGELAWDDDGPSCAHEGLAFGSDHGIPNFVLPGRRRELREFLNGYLEIRHADRWTDDDAASLLGLPYRDAFGGHAHMWKTRGRGLEAVRRALRRRFGKRKLRICERGAGVAWLSYRLALDGHTVVATDVNADARDGLRAARHYIDAGVSVGRALAEMNRLPFRDGTFDVVVNAASFHYAVGRPAQEQVIREAARVLRSGGLQLIVDSPVYRSMEAGQAMLEEWSAKNPRAPGTSYLVRKDVRTMLETCGFDPSIEAHWMGWRWSLNYLYQNALGPREPATLPLILGVKR